MSPMKLACDEAAHTMARAWATNSDVLRCKARDWSISGTRTTLSPHTCNEVENLTSRPASMVETEGSLRSTSIAKSTIASNGGGSELINNAQSLLRSAELATPKTTLHGLFFRVLLENQTRTSSLIPRPTAKRWAGNTSGSWRMSICCDDPMRCGACETTADVRAFLLASASVSKSTISLPRLRPEDSSVASTFMRMKKLKVLRVIPDTSIGRGGSISPITTPSIRSATAALFFPRSFDSAQCFSFSRMEGKTVCSSFRGAKCMHEIDHTTRPVDGGGWNSRGANVDA